MNSQSNEYFEAGMANLSLGNGTPMATQHTPNFSGEWDQQDDEPLYQHPSARPSNFIKPAAAQSNKSIIPQDMHVVQDLYDNYSQKVYIEGYVYKKNDLTVDGKSFGDPNWSKVYAELCGPVLTLWDTEFEQDENVMPQYVNITDSNVQLLGRLNDRENVLSLNSAGANRYFIDVSDPNTLVNWVCALRLSCFECSRLQEIYTKIFISRSLYSDILSKQMNKMEGLVQVRFTGTTEWQKLWVVVSDRKEEKKLFGKKSVKSKGQMTFYESKKAKSPIMTMVNVVQAYTIFPDSPQLIDLATMLKVEGFDGESPTSVSIQASTPKELVQWIIGTFDAFKLYGRPTKLIDDSNNISALNFGEPMNGYGLPRLFLEIPEVIHLNFKDETLLDNKAQFAGILLSKLQSIQQQHMSYRQSQQPMGLINQIPSGQPIYNNQSPVRPNSQRISTIPGYPNQQQGRSPINSIHSQQQSQRMNPASGRVIYASDEDSEEDEDEDDDDESDHDSVYKPQKHPTRESLSLPTMSTEDDGFASSILGNIEKKSVSSSTKQATESIHSSNTSLPAPITSPVSVPKEKPSVSEDEFGLSGSEDEAPRVPTTPVARRPKPKMAATQVSISGSDDDDDEEEEDDDDDEENSFSGSDDDIPIHQQGGRHPSQGQQQQQQYNGYPYDDYGNPQMHPQWEPGMAPDMYHEAYFDEDGYPIIDEDGPIIPSLGDRFATQNSLLDSYRPDRPSAHDQEGYARATGQPLIQVPNKPPEPRAGLVGMISQIENEKKHKETNKNRFASDLDKMDRDRDRFMMDQRSSMMPMMNQSMMGQPMMDPRMMMNMQMMGGQMPMMMDPRISMMYPGMMQQNPAMMQQNPAMMQQNPSMMNMQMMPPMMDPRMSMMMMQQQYGQYPMWNQQQAMYGNPRFNGHIDEDDDEDDDVPLGAKESPIPRHT
ncbi:uncharacterized protein EV154DRAFT_499528 [Mucor mucedo]|uniref:uncharacterized protein n=1 Tax=Mucor mucedo TaxID=29922 RepID=UPI00221FC91A|nr:uncharacterized protein EV154DRAFT_499528 [Mucor mucedo]KAI7894166.1 hypothetical protein EV154DRAFT_499528 [Mucor mucedo]